MGTSRRNSNDSNSTWERRSYPANFDPSEKDVVVGKGVNCYNHVGNKNLRKVVSSRLVHYAAATGKKDKSKVVSLIVEHVRSNGGSFVKKDEESGLWCDAESYIARDKVSQMFRNELKLSKTGDKSGRKSQFKEAQMGKRRQNMWSAEDQKLFEALQ